MKKKKGFFKSKTMWVAMAITVLGALQAFDWVKVFTSEENAGYVISGIGIVMGVLRQITTEPMASTSTKY